MFYFPRGGRGGCFDFYCFLTHSSSSLVRPLSLATCKCKDKLTTHYTSHYAPQFATPPYPFPSGMFSLVRKQIHTDCMYFGCVISLRSQKYKILKMLHLNFGILHKFLMYLKLTCMVTLFDRKQQIFENSPN